MPAPVAGPRGQRNPAWSARSPPSPPRRHSVAKRLISKAIQQHQRLSATRLVQKGGTMPLAMSRPSKHPKTGIYQLRKVVPEDLRKLVGKREEKVSLQTRDPAEAKRRHAEALAEIEARWANLRAGPKSLTEREAHQLAIVANDRWLQQHRENPSQQTSWDVSLGD